MVQVKENSENRKLVGIEIRAVWPSFVDPCSYTPGDRAWFFPDTGDISLHAIHISMNVNDN